MSPRMTDALVTLQTDNDGLSCPLGLEEPQIWDSKFLPLKDLQYRPDGVASATTTGCVILSSCGALTNVP